MKDLEEYYKNNLKGIEVGDKVYDLAFGYGIVDSITEYSYSKMIVADFFCNKMCYTFVGLFDSSYPIPSLFFNKPTYDEDGYPIPQQKEEKIDFLKWLKDVGLCLDVRCNVNTETLQEHWIASVCLKSCPLFTIGGNDKINLINRLIEQVSGRSIMRSYVQIDIPSNFALIKEEK